MKLLCILKWYIGIIIHLPQLIDCADYTARLLTGRRQDSTPTGHRTVAPSAVSEHHHYREDLCSYCLSEPCHPSHANATFLMALYPQLRSDWWATQTFVPWLQRRLGRQVLASTFGRRKLPNSKKWDPVVLSVYT